MIDCLVLVCGPPACLKSTLLEICRILSGEKVSELRWICLKSLFPRRANKFSCLPISIDDLIFDIEKEIIENESNWKIYRNSIGDEIERRITGEENDRTLEKLRHGRLILSRLEEKFRSIVEPKIVLIEENFFYSAMREKYRKIARRASIGFCSIHLFSDFDIAQQRNELRLGSKRVENDSFRRIFSRYEFPREKDEFLFRIDERGLTTHILRQILERIDVARTNPLCDTRQIRETLRQQATLINQNSFSHQIDQKLRKFLSQYLATNRHENPARINDFRKSFLNFVKQNSIRYQSDDELQRDFLIFIEKQNEKYA